MHDGIHILGVVRFVVVGLCDGSQHVIATVEQAAQMILRFDGPREQLQVNRFRRLAKIIELVFHPSQINFRRSKHCAWQANSSP